MNQNKAKIAFFKAFAAYMLTELQVPYMFSKTIAVEKAYSKADIAELRRIGRDIKESKKDAEYRMAIDSLIKATT